MRHFASSARSEYELWPNFGGKKSSATSPEMYMLYNDGEKTFDLGFHVLPGIYSYITFILSRRQPMEELELYILKQS